MGDLMKRQFNILDLAGQNFLEWKVDAQINLRAQGLEHTIADNKIPTQVTDATIITKVPTEQDKAKALVLIRHHLIESLKSEYLLVNDPKELWDKLNDRYGHHKKVLLPKANFDWINLRFQDFKPVSDYNLAMFTIVSKLKYCDQTISEEQMIDKTLSTFHPNNIVLSDMYRERSFKKYSELMSVLLVAEQNNDLLLKNHNIRPTGSKALLESNAVESSHKDTSYKKSGRGKFNNCGRGRGNYRGRGRGRGRNNFFPRKNAFKYSDKPQNQDIETNKRVPQTGKDACNRCGISGHWARTCRTAKHLADLYQASIKGKGKMPEANFVNEENTSMPSLDVSDFFIDDIV